VNRRAPASSGSESAPVDPRAPVVGTVSRDGPTLGEIGDDYVRATLGEPDDIDASLMPGGDR
jgi:hypothetical protein